MGRRRRQLREPSGPIRVSVKTADIRRAGTDSSIFLTVRGTEGSTEETRLTGPGNLFERNDTDHFELPNPGIGRPQQLILRSDGRYPGADWVPSQVSIGGSGYPVRTVESQKWVSVPLNSRLGLKIYLTMYGVEPRMAEVTPDTALAFLKRSLDDVFAWVSCNTAEKAIVDKQILTSSRGPSFAENFVDVGLTSALLFHEIRHLEDSDDPAEQAVAETLGDWIEMRERTLALFDRLDDYIHRLDVGWQIELKELEAAFTRRTDVKVDYIPAETSETVEGAEALEVILGLVDLIPVPPVEWASGLLGAVAGITTAYVENGLRGARVESQIIGGRPPIVDVVADEVNRLRIDSELYLKTLRKTSLRSIGMLDECSAAQEEISAAVQSVPAGEEAAIVSKYFPVEASLRNSMRPYWRKLLISEAVLLDDAGLRDPRLTAKRSSMDWMATSGADTPMARSRSWRLMLRGEDEGHPAIEATSFSNRALTRFHWLFSTSELIAMLVANGRAFTYLTEDEYGSSSFSVGGRREEGWARLSAEDGSGYGGRDLNLAPQRYWTIFERPVERSQTGTFSAGPSRDREIRFVDLPLSQR